MPAENFWLALQCNLTATAPEGPGWYVYAAREGAALLPLRRVSKADALAISAVFEAIYSGDPTPPPVLPKQLLDSGNILIKQAIDAQLEEAETVAKRIATLRKLQAEETEPKET